MWPFGKKLKHFKAYKALVADYVVEPINCPFGYQEVFEHIREFLWGCEANAFICGGFASALAGFTHEFGDIDIYCTNRQVYEKLAAKMEEVGKVDIVKFEGNLTKGVIYLDAAKTLIRIDLIYRPYYMGIEDLVEVFDMNWAMVGLDLSTYEVVYHPDATLNELFLNSNVDIGNSLEDADLCLQVAQNRIEKYSRRRRQEVPQDEIFEELKIHIKHRAEQARKHAY